jgi:hypothetical protein
MGSACRLLVIGAILTAFGSACYCWQPSNAGWSGTFPLAMLLTAIVSLVLADRGTPLFSHPALLPVGVLLIRSVALWGLTEGSAMTCGSI